MENVEMEDVKTLVSMDKVLPPKLALIPMKARPIYPGIFTPSSSG